MGTEVLNVRPKITDIPAARPAVRARNFCDDTSPTKAQPSEPRAALKSDQTQATKMQKFCNGFVDGKRPTIATISIVTVHITVDTKTIIRRPYRSVANIKAIEVTSAMTAES
jgi:hypothetical protein